MFGIDTRFAGSQRWRLKLTSMSGSSVGGLKGVIALVSGRRVYSKLKYESGVHRVQRVPQTEQQGRVHTSAITVAVLPAAHEVEVKLEAKDIRVYTFCQSGTAAQLLITHYWAVSPARLAVWCLGALVGHRARRVAVAPRQIWLG